MPDVMKYANNQLLINIIPFTPYDVKCKSCGKNIKFQNAAYYDTHTYHYNGLNDMK